LRTLRTLGASAASAPGAGGAAAGAGAGAGAAGGGALAFWDIYFFLPAFVCLTCAAAICAFFLASFDAFLSSLVMSLSLR